MNSGLAKHFVREETTETENFQFDLIIILSFASNFSTTLASTHAAPSTVHGTLVSSTIAIA